MAANLKIGSTGSNVERMQWALESAGYDVGSAGADGVFGPDTESALKQFQKDQGAKIDGIFGPESSGLLYGNNQIVGVDNAGNVGITIPSKSEKGSGGNAGDTTGGTTGGNTGGNTSGTTDVTGTGIPNVEIPNIPGYSYTQSDIVTRAQNVLDQHYASAPTYSSQWQAQINEYLNKIMNREEFSYNFNDDALYQQYKDIYTQMGLMSMMDTMGQAAAMTGGYGNSYAQTVGQQAYNQQLSQLNDVLPELYQMAFDRYAYEGEQLYNQYGLLMDQENMDYGRYMDSYNQWYNKLNYLTGRRDTLANEDYNKQWDEYASASDQAWKTYDATNTQAWNEHGTTYQEGRDAIDDQQEKRDWLATMISRYGYNPSDEELAAAGMTRGEADALLKGDTDSISNAGNNNTSSNTEANAYKSGTAEDDKRWQRLAEGADKDRLAEIWNAMVGEEYSESYIRLILGPYIRALTEGDMINTDVGDLANETGGTGPSSFWEMWIK